MLQRTNDVLNTSTAEFKVPSNGNGHASNSRNGRRHLVRHQVHHGYRRAVRRADIAVTLVETCGMSVTEAVERCGISTNYFYAMKALRESGNTALYRCVLRGDASILDSAKQVENAAKVIVAIKKASLLERELIRLDTGMTADPVTMLLNLTPEQKAAVSKELPPEWFWNNFIEPVMSPVTEPTFTELVVPVSESVTELNVA